MLARGIADFLLLVTGVVLAAMTLFSEELKQAPRTRNTVVVSLVVLAIYGGVVLLIDSLIPSNDSPRVSNREAALEATIVALETRLATTPAAAPTQSGESPPTSLEDAIRNGALAYYDFEDRDVLGEWSRGDKSASAELNVTEPGFNGGQALVITSPISQAENFDFHFVQRLPRISTATAIVARVRWPELPSGVSISYAVLCLRLVDQRYHCEGLPQQPGNWQTFVFNLRNGGESKTDVTRLPFEGIAIMGKFKKTSPDAPLTVSFWLDNLEIWSEK